MCAAYRCPTAYLTASDTDTGALSTEIWQLRTIWSSLSSKLTWSVGLCVLRFCGADLRCFVLLNMQLCRYNTLSWLDEHGDMHGVDVSTLFKSGASVRGIEAFLRERLGTFQGELPITVSCLLPCVLIATPCVLKITSKRTWTMAIVAGLTAPGRRCLHSNQYLHCDQCLHTNPESAAN